MVTVYNRILLILAWFSLLASWFGLAAASKNFIRAIQDYGILDARTFLDAGFGYYGLISFGVASVAVLFAVQGKLKSDKRLFQIFKVTFFLSLFFLTPVLFSMLIFLMSQV